LTYTKGENTRNALYESVEAQLKYNTTAASRSTRLPARRECAKLFPAKVAARSMKDAHRDTDYSEDVETALLDVELFLKYKSHARAMARLQAAIKHNPHAIKLRERLREVALAHNQPAEAARQCLALVKLYVARDNFDSAQERLLAAKQADPRINIAPGLEAIRRARRPDLAPPPVSTVSHAPPAARRVTFAGDLSVVSIFDAVQVIENARLTGTLTLTTTTEAATPAGRIRFNEGRIASAESGNERDADALRRLVEMTGGEFDFERSTENYPTTIQATSNTSLLLNALRELDEENK
jgi:tetratricopeptide (TPR) repeat protein